MNAKAASTHFDDLRVPPRRRQTRLLALGAGLSALLVVALFASVAGARTRTTTYLFYEAVFVHARIVDKAPKGDSLGDRQIVQGFLRDAQGRRVGSFAFTCVYVAVVRGDAHERCVGWSVTADGRVRFAGPALKSAPDHFWRITSGSGRMMGVHGSLVVHDIGESESLATATVTPGPARKPRIGVVTRPAANRSLVGQADGDCSATEAALSELPSFPFEDFDPLHPAASELPEVGRFFTGPHDPRPALVALHSDLVALGSPPAQSAEWASMLAAFAEELENIEAQDRAALAANVPAFVETVRAFAPIERKRDIAASLLGAWHCRE